MTDITELAQSLKAAAEKATPGEWRRASTQFNGITATPFMLGRKEVMIAGVSEKRDAEFIALANPANILALVEALEKSEKTSEARREAIGITHKRAARERDRANAAEEALEKAQAQSSKWLEAYHKAVSIGARYEERIAELESRTVTVKLPFTPEPSAFAPWVAKAFYQFHKDTVKSCVAVFSDACATAGIKWEVE
ncbi:ead/Ea22-like family protein [Klebsiella pneumoniae]|uniref:ead/Ea22-like family protein n=1 Tax=Klebsiella pneumoniae TaxID=573 RepID=UPI00350FCAB1